jgi:hypothetical protein
MGMLRCQVVHCWGHKRNIRIKTVKSLPITTMFIKSLPIHNILFYGGELLPLAQPQAG